jgi:GAF domain-containing protein
MTLTPRLATTVPTVPPVTTALQQAARRCLGAVPAGMGATVSLLSTDGRRLTAQGTDLVAEHLGALTDRHHENACRAAWSTGVVVTVQMGTGVRWPRWWAAVGDLGVKSVVSAPLRTSGGRLLGTALLYSGRHDAFDSADAIALAAVAWQAAECIDRAQRRRARD